jgi:hypothetical protein
LRGAGEQRRHHGRCPSRRSPSTPRAPFAGRVPAPPTAQRPGPDHVEVMRSPARCR